MCWNRILKAFANTLDPDETPQNVAKKALANSVDPDETPHDAASHQALRCLHKEISSMVGVREISVCVCKEYGRRARDQCVRVQRCWNRILKAFANTLDPDETPQNVASHQDPNCISIRNITFVWVRIGKSRMENRMTFLL
ncbi:hypothetical protein DPMN_098650 [Dreissena polymorpha]|uniref:Uncharacterized protein n=1 Tax=Dreissena polymorpha TaxID=45954 RepID=A0A9D4LCK9_DREPO|nr:hypothetical protein DPMN_098650 [Dreissena polymorpha]